MSMIPNKKFKIVKRANGSKSVKLVGFEKTRTQQHPKDMCDINLILKKYQKTGKLPLMDRVPIYDDFSKVKDYKESLGIIMKADEQFNNLPSDLRSKFRNDPQEFLSYVEKADHEDLMELGLAKHVKGDRNRDGVVDSKDNLDTSIPLHGKASPEGDTGSTEPSKI